MKENDILQAQDVRFRYDTEQPNFAVDGVSMEVHRGEFVAVLGANGCGKSTLAKHFNAILLPESGTVLVEDMDTRTDEKLYDIRQKVGMVFQNPDNQIVATVVEEDVAFALENLGVPTGEMRTRVDDAMKLAGIYEQRNKAPHKLSGGQKQRVAIAGVIAMRPDCLILDESTAMLDPAAAPGNENHPQPAGCRHFHCVHYPLYGGSRPSRPHIGHEPRTHCDGGHPEQVFSQTKRLHGYHLMYPRPPSCGMNWPPPACLCRKTSLPPKNAPRPFLTC